MDGSSDFDQIVVISNFQFFRKKFLDLFGEKILILAARAFLYFFEIILLH